MAEVADTAGVRRASIDDAARMRAHAAPIAAGHAGIRALTAIPPDAWGALADCAIEPNGYYLPAWELAVNRFAPGRTAVDALSAWTTGPGNPARLIGLLPVVSLWRACRIPLPALVSASPYGTLCTPLIARDQASEAAQRLLEEARAAGAHALVLRDVSLNGAAMKTIAQVLRQDGLRPLVLQSHSRACLDARGEADDLLRDALGGKKLKELRRQRNRLAEHGEVTFAVARSIEAIEKAVEVFLALEASGWKARRGTALKQNEGDAAFIRHATRGLAASGQCEIATLNAGETPVAAAIVLRHLERAFYFKLGIDERFSKFSPGVQLTIELTRHLCADPVLATADSTAAPHHPMINPIWRGRLRIGDVIIPLRRSDVVVPVIHAVMKMQQGAREVARRIVHRVRGR